MADMGLDFKSPPMNDVKAWQHLRTLFQVSITFHSCGCSGPGHAPADATELAKVLLERKEGYVRNLRLWLNKAGPTTKKEFEKQQEAVAYWTEQVHNIEHNLGKVLARIS
jgi:hypothetical protein